MTLSYNILESNQEIANKILKALVKELGPHFSSAVEGIREGASNLVKEAIASSPEMQSISGSTFRFDVGLTAAHAAQAVAIFAESISNSVEVKYTPIKKSGRKLKGGITVIIQSLSYQNIPDIPLAWELTSGEKANLKSILLELGDSILVYGYEIQYGPFGRSGGARMKKSAEGTWGVGAGISRVPPNFSGTNSKNFISRALESKDFESSLSTLLVKKLSK